MPQQVQGSAPARIGIVINGYLCATVVTFALAIKIVSVGELCSFRQEDVGIFRV